MAKFKTASPLDFPPPHAHIKIVWISSLFAVEPCKAKPQLSNTACVYPLYTNTACVYPLYANTACVYPLQANTACVYPLYANTYFGGTLGTGWEKSSIIVPFIFKVWFRCATEFFSQLLAVKLICPVLCLGIMGKLLPTHQKTSKCYKTNPNTGLLKSMYI